MLLFVFFVCEQMSLMQVRFTPVVQYMAISVLQNQLEIWGKAQRESARRPKSNWGEIRGEGKISQA